MGDESSISFGPFCLEAQNAILRREGQRVALTPKAFDVLHYLARRPEKLVTKDELLGAVWSDVIVSDASVKVCVREIRKALEDEAKQPRYIETVHRRGYRFIGAVPGSNEVKPAAPPTSVMTEEGDALVGREGEMRALEEAYVRARAGLRQCVFVTGGPGSGKTALTERFVARLRKEGGTLVLEGHCFEQFAASEPFLPAWEAIARVGRERVAPAVAALLARHASVHAGESEAAVAANEPRIGSERLLRDMAEAIEGLAADEPVVLLLEDVHWADDSTVDLLSALARRDGVARLLVLATYRPAEVRSNDHPLRGVAQGLLAAGLCRTVELEFLDVGAVETYLSKRFPTSALPRGLAARLHQRTEGHPLFLVHVVDDLASQGVMDNYTGDELENGALAWVAVLETQVPGSVRAMIEGQLERLNPQERQVLEAAAIAGVQFSAASAAAAMGCDVFTAEGVCEELARRHQFLEPRGLSEWPDGTTSTHYRFVHELFHNVVYERMAAGKSSRLHALLGARMEEAWGERAAEDAAELAIHFEAGRDWPRAVKYLRQAASAATRQYAHREAVRYLRRALAAVEKLPAMQRAEHELFVLMSLGVNLQVTLGFAAPEVHDVHARAAALCAANQVHGVEGIRATFPVVWGIWLFHKVRSDLRQAKEMANRLLEMASGARDAGLTLQAYQAMCVTHLCLGDPAVTADFMERAQAVYDPAKHSVNTQTYGQDPGVSTLAFGSVALWLMNEKQRAMEASERSLSLARRLGQPSSLALAMHFAAMLHQLRGDLNEAGRLADETMTLSREEGFSFWLAGGQILRGWSDAIGGNAGGIERIQRGVQAWLATGSRTYHTYFLGLLAEALIHHRRPMEALGVLDQALAAAHDYPEGLYEAQLKRLKAVAQRMP